MDYRAKIKEMLDMASERELRMVFLYIKAILKLG